MPNYDESIALADAVRQVFPRGDPSGVLAVLSASAPGERPLDERVQLACVLLSCGDLAQLRHYVREAHADARDVLYWAFAYDDEPPAHMRRFLRRRGRAGPGDPRS